MSEEKTTAKVLTGASGFPIVGNMPEFARDPIRFITRLQQEYGDVATFSLLGAKSVLISNPEDVERVLLETGKRYNNGKKSTTYALRKILGNGLVTAEGEFWKKQRKLIAPAFHHQSIRQYADQIVEYTEALVADWESGDELDIHQEMMTLTQRVIMKVLFGVDVLENAQEASRAFDAMMHAMGSELKGADAILPTFIRTPTRRRMLEGVEYINGLLMQIIEERRSVEEGAGEESAQTQGKRDLLAMLMAARDDEGMPMSDQQLLDEIRTLYLAGHETTATTLSWTWLLLSRNQEAYAQVVAEVDRVLEGRMPTDADVPQLVYCNAVIKEALRCYPVAWITIRETLEDVEIGGYLIEKGTSVFLSPWILHHDPRWFNDPDLFQPERWLKEKTDLPRRDAYIPFGGGPRVCIGNGFAMMETVLILAAIVQKAHVIVLPDHPVKMELAGTMRPKHGLLAAVAGRGEVVYPEMVGEAAIASGG